MFSPPNRNGVYYSNSLSTPRATGGNKEGCSPGSDVNSVVHQLCEVTNCGEVYSEHMKGVSLQVKGRLKQHFEFWQKIGSPHFILTVIREGYRLPFMQSPPCKDLSNNRSAFMHADFVLEAISELIMSGRVLEVSLLPHVINPLSVSVQTSGKKRLILDLRYVDQYIKTRKIKYEDWKVALSYFQKGAFI